MNKAIFCDRDGTINQEKGYLHRPEDFEFIPGVIASLFKLQQQGYLLFVVTNQSGIARGYYSEAAVNIVHAHMTKLLNKHNVSLTDIAYCPHYPTGKGDSFDCSCMCRKPNPELIVSLAKKYHVDLSLSYMIGDKEADILAGQRAGCKTCLVLTGYGNETKSKLSLMPDLIIESLADFPTISNF